MSLKEPIVEGAYYLREDGVVIGPVTRNRATLHYFHGNTKGLTRRVWITHTDPAEVVADIRRTADETEAHFGVDVAEAETKLMRGIANFVAEKLGVK